MQYGFYFLIQTCFLAMSNGNFQEADQVHQSLIVDFSSEVMGYKF